MKSVWKICKIILLFFISLTVFSMIWFLLDTDHATNAPLVDYMLYLIGYGELDMVNHYSKALFSALGLFAVTLLSSVFTVNLFELRNRAKILPHITVTVDDDAPYTAQVGIKTYNKNIYDVKASLIATVGDEAFSDERYVPVIPKKSSRSITYEIKPGSTLYTYLRAAIAQTVSDTTLLLTLTYTDADNGQEYRLCQKFAYDGTEPSFLFTSPDSAAAEELQKRLDTYIRRHSFPLNLLKAQPINGEDIRITYGYQDENSTYPNHAAFKAQVDMTDRDQCESDHFTMACIKDLADNDWRPYADMGCCLAFDYKIDDPMAVTLELKYGEHAVLVHSDVLRPSSTFRRHTISLNSSDLQVQQLSYVREICFTVFYRDLRPDNPTGTFVVKNCVIEIEP